MGRVSGKVAIVTGGAKGIGREAALTLAREGASVVVTDMDTAAGEAVAAGIVAAGGKGAFLQHCFRCRWPARGRKIVPGQPPALPRPCRAAQNTLTRRSWTIGCCLKPPSTLRSAPSMPWIWTVGEIMVLAKRRTWS
nr:SDR family NAD(P)-dependent oxidoreductase [Amaricoccus macauensis]